MMQSGRLSASDRAKLITLLPRLRRFATVLSGERDGADGLLRTACRKMLHNSGTYRQGSAFDIWAFSMLHAEWLSGLRSHANPLTQSQGESDAFAIEDFSEFDDGHMEPTLEILAKLPAQQRSAALLIYGEGFSYDEAGEILDATAETVMARLARALATFVERADWIKNTARRSAQIEQLNQIKLQAG